MMNKERRVKRTNSAISTVMATLPSTVPKIALLTHMAYPSRAINTVTISMAWPG